VELRHLRAFVAVAEHGSVSGAAGRLHLTQPSLSEQIGALERHVGRALFTRLGGSRGMALTEDGRRLLERAQEILRLVDALPTILDDAERPLRLGVPVSVPRLLLERLGAALAEACPNGVHPTSSRTSDSLVALGDGQLDMALVRLPAEAPGVRATLVLEQELGLWVTESHPLARLEAIAPARVSGMPVTFVERAAAPGFFDEVTGALASRGGYPRWVQLPAVDTGLPVRAMTHDLALLSTSEAVPATAGLVWKPFAGRPPTMRTALAWRASAPAWVLACLEKAVVRLTGEPGGLVVKQPPTP